MAAYTAVLRECVKRYRKRGGEGIVLGPISLSVSPGEVLGLRGENGAGKSTLMGMLSGSFAPDEGECMYGEGVPGHIGYVPQELSLYEDMTGLENLRFWGLAAGLAGKMIPVRSRWLMSRFALEDKAGDPVRSYSGGMKRRLHMASALMLTPKLLLLDEPTVGADAASVDIILDTARHIADMGNSVVIISHQPGELERISDRILLLSAGQIRGMV
ncbi:MAG: ABC transporter ATP-binding protein [Clostridium sp.]|nr:ABC transporter ATP-binding protein [Clostridium sp.]MBP3216098.1 ABC transporter ATP-binding protein [Clostridium sp.]